MEIKHLKTRKEFNKSKQEVLNKYQDFSRRTRIME